MCEKWVPNGIRTRSGNSTDSSANHYTIGTVTGVRDSNQINLAERSLARFKARGGSGNMPYRNDEQHRSLPDFARPSGSEKMADFFVAPS